MKPDDIVIAYTDDKWSGSVGVIHSKPIHRPDCWYVDVGGNFILFAENELALLTESGK